MEMKEETRRRASLQRYPAKAKEKQRGKRRRIWKKLPWKEAPSGVRAQALWCGQVDRLNPWVASWFLTQLEVIADGFSHWLFAHLRRVPAPAPKRPCQVRFRGPRRLYFVSFSLSLTAWVWREPRGRVERRVDVHDS